MTSCYSLALLMLSLTICAVKVTSKQVSCEKIAPIAWRHVGYQKTCIIKQTELEFNNITIGTRDESIVGLNFGDNKKVSFLPKDINKIFPTLFVYGAHGCSIKSISKHDFADMGWLKALFLQSNSIEIIDGDTFEDLESLEDLDLSSNKIKFISGQTFEGLNMLMVVLLNRNICVTADFRNETGIASLNQIIGEKCGIVQKLSTTTKTADTVPVSTSTISTKISSSTAKPEISNCVKNFEALLNKTILEKKTLQFEIVSKTSFVARLEEELDNQTDENSRNLITISRLETDLKTARSSLAQFEDQAELIKQLSGKFDTQRDETCSTIAEELRDEIEERTLENEALLSEVHRKNTEIAKKNMKIKNLEQKVQILISNNQW